MKDHQIYTRLKADKLAGKKKFAVLIDPDKLALGEIPPLVELAEQAQVDYFFVGGSLVVHNDLDEMISLIKVQTSIPVILFPGSSRQLSYRADGLLLLSLISGRNAELLIGKHVEIAPYLKISPLEIISTGYILVDGGVPTSVSYMSNTFPIPANKNSIAVCTAMAGELLGLKLLYMDAGSGAQRPISTAMIEAVSGATDIPLIIGGGIRTAAQAQANVRAGADIIVVGNVLEEQPQLMAAIAKAVHEK